MEREHGYSPAHRALWSSPEERRGMRMFVRPSATLDTSNSGRGAAILSVVILEEGTNLTDMLAGRGLSVCGVSSIDELDRLVAIGKVEAGVADPEASESWVGDFAEEALQRLGDRVPVVFVCRSEPDAKLIEARATGRGVKVMMRDRVTGAALVAVMAGEVARRQAAPSQTRKT